MASGAATPEKRLVGRSFSDAAAGYDAVAALQRRVGDSLLAEMPVGSARFRRIVDVGAGTGYCTARLRARFPDVELIAVDLAEGMLRRLATHSRRSGLCRPVCADAESLPLATGCVDLVFSNLAVQWCPDLPKALAEFHRVLRPGGALVFSSLGERTLSELRSAWASVDSYSHVNAFLGPDEIERTLASSGFAERRVHSEVDRLEYAGVPTLMHELKRLGAHNVTRDRPRHLMGKRAFAAMISAYVKPWGDERVGASFHVVRVVARRDRAGL